MNLYRGQILLTVAVAFIVLGVVDMWLYFGPLAHRQDNIEVFLLFTGGAISIIIGLVTFAMSYIAWVPKWERIEKRTGHIPGEGRKR